MPRGREPREYPPEVVDLVCGMYRDGLTVAEIRAVAPKGYRVQTILERYLPERRAAARREQRGPANHMWKGPDCGYQAAHLRVAASKGKARQHPCVDCGKPAHDWSYAHGCPTEISSQGRPPYCVHPDHYQARCRPCHRAYDRKEVDANV